MATASTTGDDQPSPTGGDPARAGVALCLSGGGYRAMLFHLGSLWRLNELGWLPRLNFVSSVSGGSITAGVLGQRWGQLSFDEHGYARNFPTVIADPIRKLAKRTVDVPVVLIGLLPGITAGERTIKSLQKHVFGDSSLQSLPDNPRFILTAANLQSGALWRFSKRFMRDYLVGSVAHPKVPLAVAVAASSGFPPMLCPIALSIDRSDWKVVESAPPGVSSWPPGRVLLGDGGIYDNLGLEPVIKRCSTILVSDGGQQIGYRDTVRRNWGQLMLRVLGLIDNQVRSLRKRSLVEEFGSAYEGTYWGIGTDIDEYHLAGALPAPVGATRQLAAVRTRLGRVSGGLQDRLINWGYAVTDAAMRTYMSEGTPAIPAAFPRPHGVGG